MADAAYAFTGLSTLGYPDYRDTETGRMLTAEPGGSYGIAAVDGKATVPPADGRWQASEPPPPPALSGLFTGSPGPEPPPEVPPVPPVPEPEGSDA